MTYSKVLANKYAANRDRYRSSDPFLSPFLKKIGIKGKIILDFGCGDGAEAERFLSMKAGKVVGVDPSREMIRLAKKRMLANATFIKSNGKTLRLNSNQFDLVYSRFVLHYIKNLEAPFIEIAKLLKKGGYFLAIFQCLTNDPKLLNKRVPIDLKKGKVVTKIKILSKSIEEVRSALAKTNLKLIKLTRVKNTDAYIDSKYKNKHKFKNSTYILLAKKLF
jgi:ubiquinone/menaquinone biosynthesis C-methylase UbiE